MLHVKRSERGLSSEPLKTHREQSPQVSRRREWLGSINTHRLLLKRVGMSLLKKPLLGLGLGWELAPLPGVKWCMTAGGGLRVP